MMSFFWTEGAHGKSVSDLTGAAAKRSLERAIKICENMARSNLQNAIDKEEEAFMLMMMPAAENGLTVEAKIQMYEAMRSAAGKFSAYSVAYSLGAAQLRFLVQIMEIEGRFDH
jgi:hypothetical protein